MNRKCGLSLIEILIGMMILVSSILMLFSVIAGGLIMVKKGENTSIATNLAMSQFEIYKGNFHMIPFYPGIADPNNSSYYYPDRTDPNDTSQVGKFVNHEADTSDLPGGSTAYYGADGASNNFYQRAAPEGDITTAPYYDLNEDGYPNDIIEPLAPVKIKDITFTPVVEIKQWNNGYNINYIKHLAVTVYWKERNAAGMQTGLKHISFEGFITRTKPDPW
jgi:type II secretory pathway pseudopilin PulG